MKLRSMILSLAALVCLAGVAYVNQAVETSSGRMATAAEKFLATLSPEQKKQAMYEFENKERTNWHFVPRQDKEKMSTRKGLPMVSMNKEQKAAALELVKAGTSGEGFTKATTIMSLEGILRDLEKDSGAMVRNPEWYFITVFGTPSKTSKWGWRVEGHHLSLNFTMDKGAVVSSTPAFFGANPAFVMDGERKGLRTLAETEDPVRELVASLTDDQKKVVLQKDGFPETPEESTAPKVGEPKGLAGAALNPKQKALLLKTVEGYANRLPADVAQVELAEVKKNGVDKVYFALNGTTEQGKPYSYRIQGDTFVIEFLNVQADSAKNPANHIHSSWRIIKGDFGTSIN
jgi:hypothetical protein